MEYWITAEKKDKIAVKDLTTIHITRIEMLGGKRKNNYSSQLSRR